MRTLKPTQSHLFRLSVSNRIRPRTRWLKTQIPSMHICPIAFTWGRAFWCQDPITVVTNTMAGVKMEALMAFVLLLPMTLAGVNDTVDQLRNGFTIVPLADQVHSEK